MSNLVSFAFEDNLVRSRLDENGEPWFVAKDVCRVLEIANHRDAVAQLDEDEKDGVGISDAIGREQETTIISESGLYALVFRSRKPQAREFSRWVRKEVLPSLRRKGYYEMPGRSGSRPVDLNPAALRLRPALRERILGSAMQCARLMGASSMAEVESIFCRCCELVASTPEQTLLPADKEAGLIRDFVGECCRNSKGAKTTAGAVYDHFRVWWNQRSKEPLPSQKRLGALLQERFVRHRRGGRIWYLDLACIM